MTGDVTRYLNLVTSEHNQRPKFMAWLAALLQAYADEIQLILSMPSKFDLDAAIGDQLDKTGEWILPSRYIPVPLENVYFSWDTGGLGWEEGIWWTPYDPLIGLTRLTDPLYRQLLYARVLGNHWDGSVPGAYAVYNELFADQAFQILIQDNGDMSMTIAVLGYPPDNVNKAMITSGLLDLRPAGVKLTGYMFPSVSGVPFFGWDVENDAIAGWEVGAWGILEGPTPES